MAVRRRVAIGAAVVAATALTAGCGLGDQPSTTTPSTSVTGKVEGEVSFQTWALKPKFTSYVEGVISAFEKENPGVKVNWLDQPGDGYSDKVLTQASSNTLPDVTNLPPDFALPIAKQGLLLDLEGSDKTLTNDYVPGGVSAYQYEGLTGTFGYPWYLGTDVNYWNSTMLKAAGLDPAALPTDLDELIAQAKIMKEKSGGKNFLMSAKPGLGDFERQGVKILSDDGKSFVFNTPEAVELVEKYRAAYTDGLMPADVLSSKYLGNSELFTQQKVAWTTGGGNTINSIRESNAKLADVMVASKAFATPPLYVQGLSVSAKSKNLPAAIALARFVTNAENQKEFATVVPGIFPSTTASAEDPFFSKSDGTPAGDAKVFAFESLKEAKMVPPVVVNQAMTTTVDQQIALALSGKVSAKQALDDAVAKCNQLLADSQS